MPTRDAAGAFKTRFGVDLLKLVSPAIGIIMFGMGTTLPADVFSIWMNFSGSILANWWSKRPAR